MKKLLTLSLCIIALASSALSQKTTRTGLRPAPRSDSSTASISNLDTIVAPEARIVDINGYDKPLRSRRETFFATNNGNSDIEALAFTIRYYDTQHRILHSASHNIKAEIPSGETRQLNFKSWDTQLNFYYSRSTAPQRVEQATPYDISITVDTIFCAPRD